MKNSNWLTASISGAVRGRAGDVADLSGLRKDAQAGVGCADRGSRLSVRRGRRFRGKLVRDVQQSWAERELPCRSTPFMSRQTREVEQPMKDEEPERGTTRMEGFSDAFFAIVITLLVLELAPPELPQEASQFVLGRDLVELWPSALAFVVSFVNVFIIWVAHHELMRITTHADTRFLYLNGGLLFGVALAPFSTALVAEHSLGPGANLSAAIYTGVFLWVALFLNLLWRYLATHPDRLLPTVGPRDRKRISRTYGATFVLYAAAFALSFWFPLWSVGGTLALAVFFAVIDRLSGFASEDIADNEPAQ
jgi:uncharacterized membrane protein